MTINDSLFTKLEKLSSLKISDDKRQEISKQLTEIVSFVENLNELDLDSVEQTINNVNNGLILRNDEPKNDQDTIEIILKNNPNSDGNFFVVPKIIE
ncbi:Asp-tRNA(Asn)/Glu-tRNA(Gln) amidotransferase subunit GatC [Campylobacter sp. RM12327]|uniref:Asp-tRNA(Asn)/Glu-tRNA(Gln) amidotransferase subunit GatC n=1 Tax=Campylobacter sputorum TaxID=206 RepID=UPI000B789586|nr:MULTISPECIES: Asp-tRNA(Asn)/Glu-tRNA(Gln) amidotransferase subunit GatC [Campylobacter]ASM39870.1 Glu-tRNA(Gln) amidotransferase, subunit C [Campylobacter sputorum]MBE7357520.1 Asp-tRNA(Asn)/Glu-tRNA(Gln) amidotransferase subunit GatC [Campylobacter sp. RM11302]MBF6669180.1 Asp-tRNA(Asn)/Glu-tRNA(Gln) amidotransferase subunit GatC [Campylobacter sp. RM12327]MBF6674345.1 Asp-tRNA(Asn)/Glu-tRNA(Gln) amidotransferase subunit GatC [Campylobacter sp. RM13538]MBF6675386.1 Asp-tRNA(Asn)/Glu-tRNA(G